MIDDGFRQEPAGAELGDRRRAVPFRQGCVIGAHHERQVGELRRREPERLVEQDLPRRVRDVVFAAHHVRHVHQRIVDDHGEVVRRVAVRPDEDGIPDDLGPEPHVAAHEIGKDDLALVGNLEADDGRLARVDPRVRLGCADATAGPRVARRQAGRDCRAAIGFELIGRTETVIGALAGEQFLGVRAVQVQPLGLSIGSVRPADLRSFVPVQAKPAEILEHARLGLVRRALDVRIFDTKDESATGVSRHQPVEQRRAGVAHVQMTGGTGCEADSHIWSLVVGRWSLVVSR